MAKNAEQTQLKQRHGWPRVTHLTQKYIKQFTPNLGIITAGTTAGERKPRPVSEDVTTAEAGEERTRKYTSLQKDSKHIVSESIYNLSEPYLLRLLDFMQSPPPASLALEGQDSSSNTSGRMPGRTLLRSCMELVGPARCAVPTKLMGAQISSATTAGYRRPKIIVGLVLVLQHLNTHSLIAEELQTVIATLGR